MIHFPEEFPLDALSVLGPIIRSGGTITDPIAAGEAVLTLQGYGMGQWLGTTHTVGATAPPNVSELEQVDRATALAALDSLEEGSHTGDPNLVGKFDPKQLGKFALQIAKFILPFLIGL